MKDDKAINLEYFDENINSGKDFNFKYKKSYEREDHIVTGECILNYLLENNYSKPFIKENYMIKNEDNSYFQKYNIFNYKTKINELIKKNKNKPITIENSLLQKILTIIEKKNENKINNDHIIKIITNRSQKINENKPLYLNTEGNKEMNNSFYEKYFLPKIKKNKKQNIREYNKKSYESNDGIFKNTSISKTLENEENDKLREEILKKPINFYSPCLRKNISPIFKNVNYRHSISVKKGKIINDRLQKFHESRFNLNKINKEKNKLKSDDIGYVKLFDKKYHLINLFKDIGKVKSPKEIEKTLFESDNKSYKIIRDKQFLKSIEKNNNK